MTSEVPRVAIGDPVASAALGAVGARHISRISAVFDAAPIGVGLWSVDGRLLHANPVLCDLLGSDLVSLQGEQIDAVLVPEDVRPVRRRFDEIWRGTCNAFPCRLLCGTGYGEPFLVRAEFTVVYGPAGLPEYLLSQIFDFTALPKNGPVPASGSSEVTATDGAATGVPVVVHAGPGGSEGPIDVERLQEQLGDVEAELAEVRRLFHAVIEVGPIAVVRLDPAGRVTYANGRWAAFLDDHQVRLAGFNWHHLLDGAQLDRVIAQSRTALETREPFVIRIASNDRTTLEIDPDDEPAGTNSWAVMQIAPVFEADGGHDGWVATVVDVSAEVAAGSRADQLARALDAGSDFLMIAERTGAISYANDAARTRLGVHTGTADRAPSFLMDMLEADSFEAWHELVHPTLLQGGVWNGELLFQAVDGGAIPVSAMFHAQCNSEGFLESIFAVARDISDLKLAERQLQQMATHDYLTGMPNRVLLYDRLEQALARYSRYNQAVALLYVDLDRFKEVNDAHGHHVGDAVLRAVADRMHELVRETDTAARIGGDEFCLLVEGISDLPTLKVIADRLIAAISNPIVIGDMRAEIGASVGLVLVDDRCADVDSLMALADAAMYRAKDSGRGVSYVSDPGGALDARG